MAYDPYGSEQEEFNIKNTIKESLNPVSLLKYKYMYDPNVYSATKGLWTPFGGIKEFQSAYESVSKTKGFWAKAGQAGKEAWSMGPFGKDHRWFNFAKTHRSTEDLLEDRLFRYHSRDVMSHLRSRPRLQKAYSRYAAKHGFRPPERMSGNLNLLQQQLARTKGPVLKKVGNIIENTRFKTIQSMERFSNKYHGIRAGTNLTRRLSKLGLAAGRTFTYFMWASTLWDIGKMVGEPIGRYIVDNVNRVSTAYMERFSPDMGGKIALGYLSTGAATERQRAIQAISKSYINGRSMLGTEAELLHG